MSEAFVPGNFNVGVNQTNPKEAADGPTESDLDYYGWRVVIAACLGVMTGFGSLFVYTFSVFVKPLAAEFGWSREAVSSGFAIAAVKRKAAQTAGGSVLVAIYLGSTRSRNRS